MEMVALQGYLVWNIRFLCHVFCCRDSSTNHRHAKGMSYCFIVELLYSTLSIILFQIIHSITPSILLFHFLLVLFNSKKPSRAQRTMTNYAQRHGGRSYRPSEKKQQSGGNIRGVKSLGGCSPMGGGGGG